MSELKNDFLKIAGDILDTDRTIGEYKVACTEVDEEDNIITAYLVDKRTFEIGNGCKENAERVFKLKVDEIVPVKSIVPINTYIEIDRETAANLVSCLSYQLAGVMNKHELSRGYTEIINKSNPDKHNKIVIYVR